MSIAYIHPNGGGFFVAVEPPERGPSRNGQFDTLKAADASARGLGLPVVHGWPPRAATKGGGR
jgi:hypothetical protein